MLILMPCPGTLDMLHPVTMLSLAARSSIPAPWIPVMTQSRIWLRSAVWPRPFPSKMMPRPRDNVISTRSIKTSLPPSKSIASLVNLGGPPALIVMSRIVIRALGGKPKSNGSESAEALATFWIVVTPMPWPSKTMSVNPLSSNHSLVPNSNSPAWKLIVPPPAEFRSLAALSTTLFRLPE